MKVYKVVRRMEEENNYCSAFSIGSNFHYYPKCYYQIGKPSNSPTGLYCFFHARDVRNFLAGREIKEITILLCKVIGPFSFPEFLPFLEEKSHIGLTKHPVPKGTILCDAILPLRELSFNPNK